MLEWRHEGEFIPHDLDPAYRVVDDYRGAPEGEIVLAKVKMVAGDPDPAFGSPPPGAPLKGDVLPGIRWGLFVGQGGKNYINDDWDRGSIREEARP